jgi:hypothetical protein
MEKYKHITEAMSDGYGLMHTAKLTPSEFLRIALQDGRHLQKPESDTSFYGAASMAEAERIQKEGYIPPAGLVKMPVFTADTNTVYMERAVVGQFPDVAAYLRGEPESMYNMVFNPEPTPTVHLAAMMNVTGGISAAKQQKHSDEVYNCIRSLQNAGNQVTLTALFYNSFQHKYETLQIEILNEGQVLSAATLGAKFHLSFYRCIWFSWATLHFSSCGCSKTPPAYVDGGKRLVIPSVEFMPKGVSVSEFVTDALRKKQSA